MTNEKMKRMFDACYQAKRIRELLPPLPNGITSSYIHFMDAIQILEEQEIPVKISDISDVLHLPRPGVTRTVKEMTEKGLLEKISSPDDGRVTYISLTQEGRNLSQKYNENYFNQLAPYLDGISEEEADCMIQTIEKFYNVMLERKGHYEQ